jgi:acetyl-CoA carboxylase biotin carboxyl carrier protein
MTLDEIRELINLLTDTGIAELEVQRGENRVRIRRAGSGVEEILVTPHAGQTHAPVGTPAATIGSGTSAVPLPAVEAHEKFTDPNVVLVKAPIVGTFYECPSPDAPPFVRIGERVQPGKVLCIIESMKLMNEIEAETGGIVESKLVLNGQPVEYGEALFAIRAV